MAWSLASSAFAPAAPIPVRHTGDGADASPPLAWTEPPRGTRELALVVDDPDAPTPEPWVHWVLYKIPASARELRADLPRTRSLVHPPGALQGKNSWGTIGWRGPAPPRGHGVHRYRFVLHALDAAVAAEGGLDRAALGAAMSGHVLATAEHAGTYQR